MRKSSLSQKQLADLEDAMISLLHASRDCMRNQEKDWRAITFDVGDGYYGEVFGIARALVTLGWAEFGTTSSEIVNATGIISAKSWLHALEQQVLIHEHFGSTHHCDYCLLKWGKDGVRHLRDLSKEAMLTSESEILRYYGTHYDEANVREKARKKLKAMWREARVYGILGLPKI